MSTGLLATKHNVVFLNEEKDRFVELVYPKNDYLLEQNNVFLENLKQL